MDLYAFLALPFGRSLKIHIMVSDSRWGNHFSAKMLNDKISGNDLLHISYYYAVGLFKLMTIPNALANARVTKRLRLFSIVAHTCTEGLGALFA